MNSAEQKNFKNMFASNDRKGFAHDLLVPTC